jgi:predicted acyl esterase
MRITKRTALAALGVAATVAGVLGATAPAQAAAPALQPWVTSADATIPGSSDGVTLDARVFEPPSGTGSTHPLIVLPASFGSDKTEYSAYAQQLAGKGYVAVEYVERGFLASTGLKQSIGPLDQADLSSVITWGLGNTAATPGKVGVVGVSLGGVLALDGAGKDPRIGAVAALSAAFDFDSTLLVNGTVPAGVLQGFSGGEDNSDPSVVAAFTRLANGDVSGVPAFSAPRDVDIAGINRNRPAVLVANGWQDSIIPASSVMSHFDELTVPKKLLLQAGDHAENELSLLVGIPNDYTTAATAWLDRFLLGVQNGADSGAPVQLAPSLNPAIRIGPTPIQSFSRTAELGSTTQTRYLSPTGIASGATPPAPWTRSYIGGAESGATIGAPMLSGLGYLTGFPPATVMASLNSSASLTWTSDPIAATSLAGSTRLHARIIPAASSATVVAYLYDVDQLGVGRLISWEPWTRRDLTAGTATTLDIALSPVLQSVDAGHRLAVVLDSSEERYASLTNGQAITIASTAADPAKVVFGVQ